MGGIEIGFCIFASSIALVGLVAVTFGPKRGPFDDWPKPRN